MDTTQQSGGVVSVHVENVGGIVETDVELEPGVNVLTGRNATNRTSFLRAIMGAMGGDGVTLRGDADEGVVELTLDGETYTRRLRRGDGIRTTGDPYLADPTVADLFAFLLESNDARRAVAAAGDLREVIMRPVDTEEIEAEIDRLEAEKREIDSALSTRDDLEGRMDELGSERDRIEARIETKREELADAKEAIDAADADLEETREEKAALDESLGELQDRRSDREEVRFKLQTERETLERLREDRSAIAERVEEEPVEPAEELEELTERIADLRERKRDLEAAVNQLQGIIQFNREMLSPGDGTAANTLAPLATGDEVASGSLAAGLLRDAESLVCWTCGTETERARIEETVAALRDRHSELVAARRSVADELEETIERRESVREARSEREARQARLRRLDEEIESAEAAIERFRSRREELDAEVQQLEAKVEELREEDVASILDLHAEANELDFEVGRLETERDRIDERIEDTAEQLERLDALHERRDAVDAELEAARTRIERLEAEIVESFNEHMDELLAVLEYDNVDRIWLERTGASGDDRAFPAARFELHVVRTTDEGAAYEDVVAHLSESEREVTGLVFALSGYLVHEVYEAVPFMLLDSLEAIDSARIGALVEYFGEYAPYLVVALLPEDAAAVDDRHARVESI